ncbi:unnamed protein product [Phaedon cochleariae]|uniref:Saposin B-type domain-containing protein n=1 Tax=Phaedon cochleariae TaxID=80249 RepID=A0A9P0GMK3_PHACE|nr:unnamed protein product [Phaedon cochleariae]
MKYCICLAIITFLGTAALADVSQEHQEESNRKGVSCVFCKLVLQTIDEIRGEHSTKKETEQAVKNVCNVLPPLFQTDCKMLIDQDGNKIIQLLNNSVSTGEVCLQIKLCPNK